MAQEYRWLRAVVPLGTLRTKKDYVRATEMLDAILDEIGEDEKHPLAELADALGVFLKSTRPSMFGFRRPSQPRCSSS